MYTKENRSNRRRILALVLCLAFILTVVPTAFAEEPEETTLYVPETAAEEIFEETPPAPDQDIGETTEVSPEEPGPAEDETPEALVNEAADVLVAAIDKAAPTLTLTGSSISVVHTAITAENVTNGLKVYYTNDGSAPTAASPTATIRSYLGAYSCSITATVPGEYKVMLGLGEELTDVASITVQPNAPTTTVVPGAYALSLRPTKTKLNVPAGTDVYFTVGAVAAALGIVSEAELDRIPVPSTASAKYSVGDDIIFSTINATTGFVVKAIAVKGELISPVMVAIYTLDPGLIALTEAKGKSETEQEQIIDIILGKMTVAQKVSLTAGIGMNPASALNAGVAGGSTPIPNFGIPSILLSDGPAGVRQGKPATVWMSPTGLASTWNKTAMAQVAAGVANEAKYYGVDVMLAPALNIHRNPMGGRVFEYYSEDPIVSGVMASAYTRSLQENGIGVSAKHFAANNQEVRMGTETIVSERALREIYLRGFEMTMKENPWTVMSSYNKINSVQAANDKWLLSDVLREDWGFKGFVMTDWFASATGSLSMIAGNDMFQPGNQTANITNWINEAGISAEEKALRISLLDRACKNILKIVVKSQVFNGTYDGLTQADIVARGQAFYTAAESPYAGSIAVNRATASEGMVLLKNDNKTLPLAADKKIALVTSDIARTEFNKTSSGYYGDSVVAVKDYIVEGGGSAQVVWSKTMGTPIEDGLKNAGYAVPYVKVDADINATAEAEAAAAAAADVGIYIISRTSSEGADNPATSFNLSDIERNIVEKFAAAFHTAGKKFIVLINAGASMNVQELKANCDAILDIYLPGSEGGNAVADIIKGAVNPSGKITQTFPVAYNDSSSIAMTSHASNAWSTNPVYYDEGVYVGYRYFDTFDKADRVAYPFGFGLSYTTFAFSDLTLSKTKFSTTDDDDKITVSVKVTNTGDVAGKEVVQLYLAPDTYSEEGRPIKELKNFAKTKLLAPNESETITFDIVKRDLQYFDDGSPDPLAIVDGVSNVKYGRGKGWTVNEGTAFTVILGNSSKTDGGPGGGVSYTFTYGEPRKVYPFSVITRVEEYGAVVPAVIIDAGENVTGPLNPADYTVSCYGMNFMGQVNTEPTIREITKAYVYDKKTIDPNGTGTASGQYIVLELAYGFNDLNGSYVYQFVFSSFANVMKPLEFYKITTPGQPRSFTNDGVINLIVDDFAKATVDGVNYRLYSPEGAESGKFPLVLWLHGAGERGTGNDAQIGANKGGTGWVEAMRRGEIPQAYVLAPQSTAGWSVAERAAVKKCIVELIEAGKVDAKRVYVAGCSMGGGGTLNIVNDDPDFFAAAIPICPAGSVSQEQANAWANAGIAVWMVHAANDPTVPVAGSRTIFANLTAAGANVYYTEVPNVDPYDGHWSWVPVLNNFADPAESGRGKIMNWLFAQKKGEMKFQTIAKTFEYSQDVIAVAIDAGKPVDASSIALDTFSVSTRNLNPNNNAVTYNGAKTITKAYVNDAANVAAQGKSSGRYIILELAHGYGVAGATTQIYTGGRNLCLIMNYQIAQNKDYKFASGAAVSENTYAKSGEINLIVDDFARGTVDNVNYRLYTPENADDGKLPLVLWLHGAGESGTNNEAQIRANMGGTGWVEAMMKGDIPYAYVLAPQASAGWSAAERASVKKLINEMIDGGKVDPARVYVAGCSMGGGGTVNIVHDDPSFFAATIPVCAVGAITPEQAEAWADAGIAVWLVHAANDPTVNVSGSRTKLAALTAAGANAYYTEFANVAPYNGHWSWVPVLNNFTDPAENGRGKIMNWLFEQKKVDRTFDTIVNVLEWGSAVTAVIIDAGRTVNASTVETDAFAVSAITKNPVNNNVVYDGARTITKAYVSETREQGKPAASGRYIVLELKYGYNATQAEVNGSAAIIYQSRNYWLNMEYTVTQKKRVGNFFSGSIVSGETVRPIYDDFALVDNPVETFQSQKYRMYTPDEAAAGQPLPLVIFNHGAGETYTANGGGNEGSQLFANMGGVGWVKNAPEASFVLVPQRSFSSYSRAGVIAFVKDLIAKGKVDGNRVYVSGASAGGSETHSYLREYPDVFAAAVPICPASGSSLTVEQLEPIKHIPIWYVHAETDRSVQPINSQQPYERLLALGARDVRRTLFPYVFGTEIPTADYANTNYPDGHWSWVMLLNNEYVNDAGIPGGSKGSTFMSWLFAQRKNTFADISTDTKFGAYYYDTEAAIKSGAKMIIAQYLANGELIDFVMTDILAGTPTFLRVDKAASCATSRAFAWNGDMLPLEEALTLKPSAADPAFGEAVKVTGGFITGVASDEKNVAVYKGVPFAKPPVGDLRWKAPQNLDEVSWSGVRVCDTWGYQAYQNPNLNAPGGFWGDEFYYDGSPKPEVSEDCLYLNVYTPARTPKDNLPVMVWIHGGGFDHGFASEVEFNAAKLAAKGVIVVQIQYRVGAFGFLALPGLSAENEKGVSGNYGFLDQVKSLEWVRQNIAAFGGNPGNVTIFGQSAGAMSVRALLSSPLAKGLFHRAILQSGLGGYISNNTYPTLATKTASCSTAVQNAFGTTDVAALRKLSAAEILAKGTLSSGSMTKDGYVFTDESVNLKRDGAFNGIDIMVGGTADEYTSLSGNPNGTLAVATFQNTLKTRFGAYYPNDETVFALYGAQTTTEAYRLNQRLSCDNVLAQYRLSAMYSNAHNQNHTAYTYYFEHKLSPHSTDIVGTRDEAYYGAFHSSELWYMFNSMRAVPKQRLWSESDYRLGNIMATYWSNFARTGNPNGSGLPTWSPCNANTDGAIVSFRHGDAKNNGSEFAARDSANFQYVKNVTYRLEDDDLKMPTP